MEKVKTFTFRLIRHELVSGSFYIFIGTTISGILAFFLNLFFARTLSYQDYGTYSALISLVNLLTIPAMSLTAIIVRYATRFFTLGEEERAGAFYRKTFKYILIFSLLFNLSFLIFSPVISSFLKINEIGLILLIGVIVSAFYITTINIAFLQSLLKFKLIGIIHSLTGVLKLTSGVILVLAGFKVYGAISAFLTFSILGFVLSFIALKKFILKSTKDVNITVRDFGNYAIPASVSIFSLSSFITADVLLVKHYFTSYEAGLYGGLALIGRVIFYFTGPIPIAMFPLLVKRHTQEIKFQNIFYLALLLVILPSIAITVFYFLFPGFVINLFLGGRDYLKVAPLLGLMGVFLVLFSINNVFVNFFLSIKKTIISLLVLLMAIFQIILIILFHENFYQIIMVSILSLVLLLILLLLYYLRTYGTYYAKK